MKHFHLLQVQKIFRTTEDCVVVSFAIPQELQDVFQYTHGQSLTLRKELNGTEARRTYSICSAPGDAELRIAVKKVEGGSFSQWANSELKPGDYLEVMPPVGKFFTPLDPAQRKKYVAFAAGSGITPILSIIKTTLRTEPRSEFTLVFGNRSKNSIIFRDELQDLKDQYLDRFRIYHVLSREKSEIPLQTGRIDTTKLAQLSGKIIDFSAIDDFFLCGPEEMIFSVRNYLEAEGIAPEKIHFELFTVPGQKSSTGVRTANSTTQDQQEAKVKVKLDGLLFEFPLAYEGQTILDAALRQGADLPYACKGGVCTTCKARLIEGQVDMDVNWGLEPDEIRNGFVLTCQAHPRSSEVLIDFDTK